MRRRTAASSPRRPRVVIAGHICLDITPKMPATAARSMGDLLVPGKLLNVGECVFSAGGAVPNTGLSMVRMGTRPRLAGKIGDDPFGRAVLDIVRRHGCERDIRVEAGAQTSYTVVVAPPGIDRVFLHNPGANDTYSSADLSAAVLEDVDLFHFGYPPLMARMFADGGAETVKIARKARRAGAIVSLDMAQPDPDSPSGKVNWRALLREVLPFVDLFVPSIDEVIYFLDRPLFFRLKAQAARQGLDSISLVTPEVCARFASRLLAFGAGVVLLKCGHRGLYLRTAGAGRIGRIGTRCGLAPEWADRELWEPSFFVARVVSATGAGDSTIAAFLLAVLRGETPEQALKIASAAGALNVTAHDAISGLLPYETMAARIPAWRKRPLEIHARGWRFDAAARVWRGPAGR